MAAQTRAGRQMLNLDDGERLAVACAAEGDHAMGGRNRKRLAVPLAELLVPCRGKGVLLQRYRVGGWRHLRDPARRGLSLA